MTNNKQQTAVEWFFEQLTEVDYNCINKTFLKNDNSLAGYRLRELLKQAKEMEKEKTKKSWVMGLIVNLENPFDYNFYEPLADKWYETTYGGGEQ